MAETTMIDLATRLSVLADSLDVPDGGFSVDPRTLADVSGGYAVCTRPDAERVLPWVTEIDILSYMREHAELLSEPGSVLGAWRCPTTGRVFLDVSRVVSDQREALQLARAHGQVAVFSFATLSSIGA